MTRDEKIACGGYVYFSFLRPFAEVAGVAGELDWTVPRDTIGPVYDAMSQIEGTNNRITIAIRDYNAAVQAYNTRIRTFPSVIGARIIYGSHPMVPFEATAGANVAPNLDFGNIQ